MLQSVCGMHVRFVSEEESLHGGSSQGRRAVWGAAEGEYGGGGLDGSGSAGGGGGGAGGGGRAGGGGGGVGGGSAGGGGGTGAQYSGTGAQYSGAGAQYGGKGAQYGGMGAQYGARGHDADASDDERERASYWASRDPRRGDDQRGRREGATSGEASLVRLITIDYD